MTTCVSCGLPIPDGQGRSCSMCYGDIAYGRDGYYEKWAREREEDAALARFAAPRGRVVEGWAVVHDDYPDLPDLFRDRSVAEKHVGGSRRLFPCVITILDAPPRGEEGEK